MSFLIEFKSADIFRRGQVALKDICWKIQENESWVVMGNIASGKTTLLQAVAGLLHIKAGEINYNLAEETIHRWELKKYISLVSFSNRIVSGNEFYYQQRYNYSEDDNVPTVLDYLGNHDFGEPHFEILRIRELLSVELIKLSNGQTRRVLLAKTLSLRPKILLLDNPFAGLDRETRTNLMGFINDLVAHGQNVIITCMHPEDIPPIFTHLLHLSRGAIDYQGTVGQFKPAKKIKDVKSLDAMAANTAGFSVAVELKNASVRYGEKQILDCVNWAIRNGEKWALLGNNGSGKSTLLSMLNADNPQAYRNDIILFDEKRQRGQSIWKIKKRIGFFSPELQAYFQEDLTAADVIATGYTDTFVPLKSLTSDQEDHISNLLSFFSKSELYHKKYLLLSSGEQRLVMFLRSLVKPVDLLILDEPFQGFDEELIEQSKSLLDQYCLHITLIFVTHYEQEIPSCVSRTLRLEGGRVV